MLGYAVECALKACLAKQIRRYDFPELQFVRDSYTHNLVRLLRLSGLTVELEIDSQVDANLELNWGIVKDWSELRRYEPSVSEDAARDFHRAVTTRRSGILPWLRKRW